MNYFNSNQNNINPAQFRQIVPSLNEDFLRQLVNEAKQKGISDKDIEEGLKFIQSLK